MMKTCWTGEQLRREVAEGKRQEAETLSITAGRPGWTSWLAEAGRYVTSQVEPRTGRRCLHALSPRRPDPHETAGVSTRPAAPPRRRSTGVQRGDNKQNLLTGSESPASTITARDPIRPSRPPS